MSAPPSIATCRAGLDAVASARAGPRGKRPSVRISTRPIYLTRVRSARIRGRTASAGRSGR